MVLAKAPDAVPVTTTVTVQTPGPLPTGLGAAGTVALVMTALGPVTLTLAAPQAGETPASETPATFAGNVSVNPAGVMLARLKLFSVMVSSDVPPTSTVVGANALVTLAPRSTRRSTLNEVLLVIACVVVTALAAMMLLNPAATCGVVLSAVRMTAVMVQLLFGAIAPPFSLKPKSPSVMVPAAVSTTVPPQVLLLRPPGTAITTGGGKVSVYPTPDNGSALGLRNTIV